MTALLRDLQRIAATQEAGLAAWERRSLIPPIRYEPMACCPVCGSRLDESDEVAYELTGAARSDCLGCQHCTDLDELEQAHDLLRYTAWEVNELWK